MWLDKHDKVIKNLILDSNNPLELVASEYLKAAKSTILFTFISCCVIDGFDFEDFEMLRKCLEI